MTNFLVFRCYSLLCTNDYIARLYSKIAFNISSDSYGVHVQVILSHFEISVLISTHKLHLNASLAS